MASALQLFPANVAFVKPDGTLTREAIKMMGLLEIRVGGPIAQTINELVLADDDDSGLEEWKAEGMKALDALAMRPVDVFQHIQSLETELAGLRETVAELTKQVQGLQEGLYI